MLDVVARLLLVAAGGVGFLLLPVWLVGVQIPMLWMAPPSTDTAEASWSVALLWSAINLLQVLGFGVMHTALAQEHVKGAISRALSLRPEMYRAMYVAVAGLHLLLVTVLWHPTAVAPLWHVQLGGWRSEEADMALFGFFGVGIAYVVAQHGAFEFLGIRASVPSAAVSKEGKSLVTTGIYGLVRHPMYTVTMAGVLLPTRMTLDRLVFALGALLYLYGFGVPIEEQKLLAEFGAPYAVYQRSVPAVVPGPLERWLGILDESATSEESDKVKTT